MILFSAKTKLEKEFLTWANKNNAMGCPLNVITFLETKGMLNEKAIKDYFGKDYGIKR